MYSSRKWSAFTNATSTQHPPADQRDQAARAQSAAHHRPAGARAVGEPWRLPQRVAHVASGTPGLWRLAQELSEGVAKGVAKGIAWRRWWARAASSRSSRPVSFRNLKGQKDRGQRLACLVARWR